MPSPLFCADAKEGRERNGVRTNVRPVFAAVFRQPLRYGRNDLFIAVPPSQTKKYSILVYSIPTELASCDVQDTVSTMINRIKDGLGNAKLTRDILFEKALYQASCKAAIKAGREYVEAHVEWIVEQLMKIPDITFCPHGRPVAMELSKRNLDHQFERT